MATRRDPPPRPVRTTRRSSDEGSYLQGLGAIREAPLSHHVVMLQSNDPTLTGELSGLLVNAIVPEYRDFNFSRIPCTRETTAGSIIGLAEELPILGERRLCWLCDVHQLSDQTATRLSEFLGDLPPSTWMFMSGALTAASGSGGERSTDGSSGTASASEPAGASGGGPASSGPGAEAAEGTVARTGLRKMVEATRRVGIVIGGSLSPDETRRWLLARLERLGLTADAAACDELLKRAGLNLTALSTEVEKLACWAGERRNLQLADVERLVIAPPASRIFELSDALASRNVSSALVQATELVDSGTHPLVLLAYLATWYRGLIKVHGLAKTGHGNSSIASQTGMKDWLVDRARKTSARLGQQDLERAVALLLEADQHMKRGGDDLTVLQRLILRLCGIG